MNFHYISLFLLLVAATHLPAGERQVSYNRDVRPILSNNCFFCHGFDKDKREADLRLDDAEAAMAVNSEGRAAIVAGEPDKSELIKRILTNDPDDVMPPSGSAYSLSQEQKETLTLWIRQGAKYEEHWAYKKIERPAVPEPPRTNPIDAFLQEVWDQERVKPVAKADPWTLLRRLSYDLRGLPPSLKEIADFQNDPSPGSYQKFVHQWTTSTEYAEHQGLKWLDLVRWADSSGMVSDEPIATGPYRKYVIESFRDNLPFDRFTREQLAGDLLPARNERTLIASAYNRLVKTNSEAGVIEKEALHALQGEHVRAMGNVWLGSTTGCAECHDHKYDPITAKDYYSLAAFFDDLIEVGVYAPGDRRAPVHYLHEDQAKASIDAELSDRANSRRERLAATPVDPGDFQAWEAKTLAASDLAAKDKNPADWEWVPAVLPPARVLEGDFIQAPAGRQVDAPDGQFARHRAGEFVVDKIFGDNNGFYTNLTLDPAHPPEMVALETINGAYGRLAWHPHYHVIYYWGKTNHPLLKENYPLLKPSNFIHMGSLPEAGKSVRLEVPKTEFPKLDYETVGLGWIQAGGTVIWGGSGYVTTAKRAFTNRLARSAFLHWWEAPVNRDDKDKLPTLADDSLRMEPPERSPFHNQVLRIAYQSESQSEMTAELLDLYRQLSVLRKGVPITLVSKVGPLKETRLRDRGNFMDDSGPQLDPAIPAFLGSLQSTDRATRLDLADWLVSPFNPLTPRVLVNRLWHQFYGRGLCETLDDVGNQGSWPSHPELIDWLAAELVENKWDVRHIIRLLVSTEAYQLSSVPGESLYSLDPTNRLHARQSRHRYAAEEIRDSALLAAGLLQLTAEIPTRSFFPYQPDSYWEKSNKIMFGSRYQIWDTTPGAGQHQRSLYTYWKRQNPHPSMLAFDVPTRQECTAIRPITNTPGQALVLLNDPTFVEAACSLAARVMAEKTAPDDRIARLYQHAVQREPTPDELREVRQLFDGWLDHFGRHPDEAAALLTENPSAEKAAWTIAARLVLNLHEFITRS